MILSGIIFLFGCQPQVDIAAEEAAIKAVNEKNMAAANAADYEGEAEVWAHEPYIVHGFYEPVKVGWDTLSAHYKTTFSNREPGLVFHARTASNYDIRMNGNIAFVLYDEHVEFTQDGEKRVNDYKTLKYFEKKNGQWKVIGVFPG
jgi:ketosteroid isomerase-like protein